MKQPVSIRDAKIGDAVHISNLFAQLGFPVPAPELAGRLRLFSAPGRTVLLAVHEGRIVGVCTLQVSIVLHRSKTMGRISAMVVDENHRGQGIGGALLAAAEERLKGWGCGLIEITSNNGRPEAQAFFKYHGYEETSSRFAKTL